MSGRRAVDYASALEKNSCGEFVHHSMWMLDISKQDWIHINSILHISVQVVTSYFNFEILPEIHFATVFMFSFLDITMMDSSLI